MSAPSGALLLPLSPDPLAADAIRKAIRQSLFVLGGLAERSRRPVRWPQPLLLPLSPDPLAADVIQKAIRQSLFVLGGLAERRQQPVRPQAPRRPPGAAASGPVSKRRTSSP